MHEICTIIILWVISIRIVYDYNMVNILLTRLFCFRQFEILRVPKERRGRGFHKFAVLKYSQLQSVLPETTLGSNSDWDGFLQLDLNQTTLPFKTADDYVTSPEQGWGPAYLDRQDSV